MNQCLISHAHTDARIADEIAKIIQRVSLQGITVWHSSDDNVSGGIGAGELWPNSIREKLLSSRSIIALLTPHSIERPWVYFESGFGAASAELEVIPVAVGLSNLSAIPMPLAMYKCYLISDINSLEKFLSKLFFKFEVNFDAEMAASPMRNCIKNIANIVATEIPSDADPSRSDMRDHENLVGHIDKRFFELLVKLDPHDDVSTYSVSINVDFPPLALKYPLEIDASLSLQDALDACWGLVASEVEPFTYLENWILEETNTARKLVVREIQHQIPARYIFRPGTEWRAHRLDAPYSPAESNRKARD